MSNTTTPDEVKRYQREKLTVRLISLAVSLLWLTACATFLGPRLRGWSADWLTDCPWLHLLAALVLLGGGAELLSLPFSYYSGFVLEHRYGLSTQTLGGWLRKQVLALALGGLFAVPLFLGFYALLWFSGAWWWLWAALAWLAVTVVLGRLLPIVILPLFYRVTPLNEPSLQARFEKLVTGTGLTLGGVYQLHLSDETRKANAALAGLGSTRRVLLGDTLLSEFTPDEIEVVFAHEVGHHVYRHLFKMIVISVASAAVGFWLVDQLLRWSAPELGYLRFDDPFAVPLVLLVLTLFGLLLSPAENALSRFFERQCDRYALQRTGLREAYISAFTKLAKQNKADPEPHPLVVWLFYDHPPIKERLALAE